MISKLKGLLKKFGGGSETVKLKSSDRLRLSGKALRVVGREASYVVEMGKQTLHICPDRPVNPLLRKPPYDYVIFDPKLFHSRISQSLRLRPGETLSIDYRQEQRHPHPSCQQYAHDHTCAC